MVASQAGPRSSSRPPPTDRITSHGRGGAGNISTPRSPALVPADLQTPTIKQNTYTTGRGGTGNMALNDKADPTAARMAQDLDGPAPRVSKDLGPETKFFVGRGGDGNVARVGKEEGTGKEKEKEKESGTATVNETTRSGNAATAQKKGAVKKGKDLVGAVLARTRSREVGPK